MKIKLRNIGMLQEAELDLNSLTLIAGENDNGKSTIGKVMFCIIKAINRYKEELNESKEHKLEERLENLFFLLRVIGVVQKTLFDSEGLSFRFLLNRNIDIDERLSAIEEHLSSFESQIKESDIKKIKKTIEEIKDIKQAPEDEKKYIESALNKAFFSEFDSSILLNGEEDGQITLFENKLELINIKISKDNKISLIGEVEPIQLKDATFIETPLILNNHDLLIRSQSGLSLNKRNIERLGVPYTTLHTKDLFDKLKLPHYELFLDGALEIDFLIEIQNIIDGYISYDNQKKDFTYSKNKKEISIKNTASGIKSFGILQLLLVNRILNPNSILIIDEPENHLHPKWQLKYAKILVALAKNNIKVLLASHSPYMIEAIKRYSDLDDLEQDTNFYLAKDSIIEPKNKLEEIFRTLEEPFEIFRQMDMEILKDE